eukprot:scpid110771/ scgid11124/ 
MSALKRKLSLGAPAWMAGGSSSSSDSAKSSSSNPDPAADSDSADNNPSASDNESESSDDSGANKGYRFLDLECLQAIVTDACLCKLCGIGSLVVNETARSGLATLISLTCSNDECSRIYEASAARTGSWRFFK